MEYTGEQLGRIEELAGAFMTVDEIALLVQIERKTFRYEVLKPGTPINEAYQRGKLISKEAIQKNIVKMAQMGSPQAQKDVRDFITVQNKAERER